VELVDQLVGHQRCRLVLPAFEVEILHPVGELGVPHPHEDLLVEVRLLRAHAAHAEGQAGPQRVEHRPRVVGDLRVTGAGDLEVLPGTTGAGAGEALVQPRWYIPADAGE
jgi:hypothetical protein